MNDDRLLELVIAGMLVGIGGYQGLRHLKTATWTSFSIGIQRMGRFTAALSILSSLVGGFIVFGVVQMGYEGGFTAVILGSVYLVSIPLFAFVATKLPEDSEHKWEVFGIDSCIAATFGHGTSNTFCVVQICAFFALLAAQFLAIGSYLRVFHGLENIALALALGAVLPVAYTAARGMSGVLSNDLIQGACVIILLVVVGVPVFAKTGLHPPTGDHGNAFFGIYGPVFGLSAFLVLIPTLFVRVDIWQRLRNTKPEDRTIAISLAFITVFLFYTVFAVIGWNIRYLANRNEMIVAQPVDVFSSVVHKYVTHAVPRALVMAGVLSALISSIDSYLIVASLGLVRLLYVFSSERAASNDDLKRDMLSGSRVAVVIIALLACLLAYAVPNIVDMAVGAFSAIVICVPVTLISLLTKRRYPDWMGVGSLVSGIVTWSLALPTLQKAAFLPGVVISTIVLAIGFVFITEDESPRI